jgi:protein-disulfide isomerase
MKICAGAATFAALLFIASIVTIPVLAQNSQPEAPEPSAQSSGTQPAVSGPLQPMPPPDPVNFTATTPTKGTVEAFLRSSWGYDENRIYQVQAIEKTQIQGISRVTVLVEEKGAQQTQPSALVFLTLPDGKHLISNDEILPFGEHPFESYHTLLEQQAKGPSRGPANSSLQLVEFSDFQCPHCKEAQPTVERLLKDYPQARFVSQMFPLRNIHSEAEKAAETGVCVAKIGGNDAFFKFTDAIYANQAQLTPEGSAEALGSAAKTAGVDDAKVKACVAEPSTKAAVDASIQLGQEIGVNQTPMLVVNGRLLPLGIPYDQLKKIIDYDMK